MTHVPAAIRAKKKHRLPLDSAGLPPPEADYESGVRNTQPPGGPFAPHLRPDRVLAAPYHLGPHSRRVLAALIAAICPSAPSFEDSAGRIERGARTFLSYMNPAVARVMALGIVVLDVLPVLMLFSRQRLSALPRDSARRFLTRVAHSRLMLLRTLIAGVRGLVLSLYFDQPEIHAAMRYAPVPFIRERVQRRAALLTGSKLQATAGS